MKLKKLIIDTEIYRGKNENEWTFLVGELDSETQKIEIKEFNQNSKTLYIPSCDRIIGFNFMRYDAIMIWAFNNQKNLQKENDKLINGGYKYLMKMFNNSQYTFKQWLYGRLPFNFTFPTILDLASKQFTLSASVGLSLKNKFLKIFGYDIWDGLKDNKDQFKIPNYFNDNREECIKYLKTDLKATFKIWKSDPKKNYINIIDLLIKLDDDQLIPNNANQIDTNNIYWILFNEQITYLSKQLFKPLPFQDLKTATEDIEINLKDFKDYDLLKVNNYHPYFFPNNEFCVSNSVQKHGGLHNNVNRSFWQNNLYVADFTALYPHLLLRGQKEDYFKTFSQQSLIFFEILNEYSKKWKKGTAEQINMRKPLKILLNSVYGLIKYMTDDVIHNTKTQNWICKQGRRFIIYLTMKLIENFKEIKIINVNTDGVFFQYKEDITSFINEVGDFLKIPITVEKVDFLINRDVNNLVYRKNGNKIVSKGCFNPSTTSRLEIEGKYLNQYGYVKRKEWLENMVNNKFDLVPRKLIDFLYKQADGSNQELFINNLKMATTLFKLGLDLNNIEWSLTKIWVDKKNQRHIIHRRKGYTSPMVLPSFVDEVNPFTSSNVNIKSFNNYNSISIKPNLEYVIIDDDDPLNVIPCLEEYREKTLVIYSYRDEKKERGKFIFKNTTNTLWKLNDNINFKIEVKPFAFFTIIDKDNQFYINNNVNVCELPYSIKKTLLKKQDTVIQDFNNKIESNWRDIIIEKLTAMKIKAKKHINLSYLIQIAPPCHINQTHHKKITKSYMMRLIICSKKLILRCFCDDKLCVIDFSKKVCDYYKLNEISELVIKKEKEEDENTKKL